MSTSTKKIFVSYSREDAELAHRVSSLLRREDRDVWTDRDVSAGDDWEHALKEHIREADMVVALLSPRSRSSAWLLREPGAVWALDKPLRFVATDPRLVEMLPVDFGDVVIVDASDEERIFKLADAPFDAKDWSATG